MLRGITYEWVITYNIDAAADDDIKSYEYVNVFRNIHTEVLQKIFWILKSKIMI